MKLWKLNAILLIICICISFVHISCEKKTNHKSKHIIEDLNDAYAANDEYLKRMEELSNENKISIQNQKKETGEETAFLEKSSSELEQSKKKNLDKKQKKPSNVSTKQNKKKTAKKTDLQKLIKSAVKKFPAVPRKMETKIIPNPLLNKNIKNIESYAKCNKKTGIINLIKGQDQLPYTLNLLPVYGYLGLSTFNLYKNKNPTSLITTIKIIDILRVSQRSYLKNNFCFDLVLNENVKLRLETDDKLTLCASSKDSMEKWIQALLEFKECQIDVKRLNKNDQVVVDYKKVDELLKDKSIVQTPKQKIKKLYYDGSNTAIVKSSATISKQMRINAIVKNIMNSLKEGNIRTNQVRRQLANKLKKARGFTQDIRRKEEIIREMVEKRIEMERQKEVVNVSKQQKKKEVELLRAVQQRIIQLKREEIKEYSNRLTSEIRGEKEKASKQAKNMMRMLIDAKKLTPYDDCTDNRVLNFENQSFIFSTCKRYYGEHRDKECRIKENFCNLCCAHHVGSTHFVQLTRCKNVCSGLLKGIRNEINGDYEKYKKDVAKKNKQ